jgi:hypothetical protein
VAFTFLRCRAQIGRFALIAGAAIGAGVFRYHFVLLPYMNVPTVSAVETINADGEAVRQTRYHSDEMGGHMGPPLRCAM